MRNLLLSAFALLLVVSHVCAQKKAFAEYEKRRTRVLAENGQRHLELGSWARDAGLVPQATAEFLLAVEVAEGRNPGALKVLSIMRSLDERFWTKHRKHPGKALLRQYDKKARKARRDDRAGHFKVAQYAHAHDMQVEALRDYTALVGDRDEALEVDGRGRIVLDVGAIPQDISARLLEKAVEVDQQLYVRDAELPGLPDASKIHECSTEELRVRGTLDKQRVEQLHALGTALLPLLEEHVGGRPVERVKVFVFATRAEYAVYLAANAMQRYDNAGGFADYGAQQAIVCAEGCDEQGLHGLFLHELAHLYDYQVAPAAFPSWYREALAESIGGRGAFAFDGKQLKLGGAMDSARRAQLANGIDAFSARQLLADDAGALFGADAQRAKRFYVEAWGFYEFLQRGAGENVAERLAVWEAMCRGKAVGAQPRQSGERRRTLDEREARELFDGMFGSQLDELEQAFKAWARGD